MGAWFPVFSENVPIFPAQKKSHKGRVLAEVVSSVSRVLTEVVSSVF